MTPALDTSGLHALYIAGHALVLPHAQAARTLAVRLRASPLPVPADAPDLRPPLAWREWTASLWAALLLDGVDDRPLLNRLQEEQLWVAALAADAPSAHPSTRRDLAALARAAMGRAAAHRVLQRLHSEADSPDSRHFAAAADLFRTHCARHRLLPPALLDEALAIHLASGALQPPETLHLIGFEQETEARKHLLAALERAGTAVHRYPVQPGNQLCGERLSATLPDRLGQLRFAVRLIADHARSAKSPSPCIALICPPKVDDRPELDRLFRDLLAPELESIHADLSSTPWHFATPPPLRSAPMVAAALDVLQWTTRSLPLERIGQLLLSPFLGHTDPLEDRARFEARTLRRTPVLRPALDLASFLPLLRAGKTAAQNTATQSTANADRQVRLPELRSLSRAAEQADLLTAKRSHAHWADQTRKLLGIVRWPGPRALSPAEFRVSEAWEGLLDLLSTLQFQGQRLTFSAFLELLIAEAGSLPCPVTHLAAPVQVLTLAESEGLAFDFTVVLDATDKQLPTVEARHPLLPHALQRSLGIGDSAHALTQTRIALDNLARRSGLTLLLAPATDDDAPAQLTLLAAQLAFRPVPPSSLLPNEDPLNPWLTEAGPSRESLPTLRNVEVHGGAEVLKLQAACGFRAFASLRLAGEEPQSHELGLNALETGRLLHTALEVFWAGVGSRSALDALPTASRHALIAEAVEAAITRLRPYPGADNAWSAHFLHVLKRRYTNLLLRWLDLELGRSPFTVLAQEKQATLTLGPIRLKLRPDRIDEVDGGLVYIDYKSTYDLRLDQWTDTRPEAPQLPAYALCADPDQLAGIAFGQIRPDRTRFGWISLSQGSGTFPRNARNKEVDMHDQLGRWRDELTALAEAFAAGDASVNPKSYPETCKYCTFRTLCRLDPATLLDQANPDDEPDDDEEETGG